MADESSAASTLTAAQLVADRYRQIHLDFHTSPLIPDVGAEFDAERFADTLADARVNWVTLFGKCHHGMSYYPTKAKLGMMHPGLKFDLLGAQIEACKKRGIATPVYISARVDQHIGMTRPDLLCRLEDGKLWGPAYNEAKWYQVCLNNTEYIDYLAEQTREVFANYDADGIFYDMCYYPPAPGCFCEKCLARLEASGHKRDDKAAHRRQTFQILREYSTRLASLCKELRPNAATFFNSRVTPNVNRELDVLTHLEIESLTTGGWGYLYFPCHSRVVRTYDRPLQGMTARFHKSWADFGGLKTTAQLHYEAATILAANGVINIGDQLHPRGTLDTGAYQVIGDTFQKVEAVEEYCRNARPLADIAVLLLPDNQDIAENGEQDTRGMVKMDTNIEGAAAVLAALKHQWNGETPDRDNLNNYKVVIIPDKGYVSPEMRVRLEAFLRNGGKILFSHEAGLQDGQFNIPNSPVRYIRECPYMPSYMKLGHEIGSAMSEVLEIANQSLAIAPDILSKGLPDSEFVNYRASSYVEAVDGATPLGQVLEPYFNRAPEHFSSHAQTPYDKTTNYPVAVIGPYDAGAYIYAAVFQGYREDAFFVYKEIIGRVLKRLLPEPLVRPGQNVSPAMEIAVLSQPAQNRLVAHVVNFQPQRRTSTNEFIEEATPVNNISFAVRTQTAPTRVTLVPSGEEIAFEQQGSYCHITLPVLLTQQIVAFEGVSV